MRAILAAIALSSAGCGTAANTLWLTPDEGGQRIYGGVRVDLDVANPLAHDSGIVRETGPVPLTPAERMGHLAFLCIDLPLSAIGDTLTLPIVLAGQLSERRTMIRSFESKNVDIEHFLAVKGEPIGQPTTPPPPIGLDRFPEVRHRISTQ